MVFDLRGGGGSAGGGRGSGASGGGRGRANNVRTTGRVALLFSSWWMDPWRVNPPSSSSLLGGRSTLSLRMNLNPEDLGLGGESRG